jgi:hypothetical protein
MCARAHLRGKDRDRRVAGGSSSLPLSPGKKTLLWQRLRKYDRKLAELEHHMLFAKLFMHGELALLEKQRALVDEKRKLVRCKLQSY